MHRKNIIDRDVTPAEMSLFNDAYERFRCSKVDKIESIVSMNKVFFMSDKFDQYCRPNMHNAFSNAFQVLIKQILAEPEDVISEYRESLTKSILHVNAQLIFNIVPTLENCVIGRQEPLPRIDSIEAKNRFTLALQDFVSI